METKHEHQEASHKSHYRKLGLMIVISLFAMYFLMYSMVDKWENVIHNVNQVYMAGLMTAAMVLIELVVMGKMYPNKKVNSLLMIGSALLVILFYVFIRKQSAIGDKQFVKSMIPHHAAAILMVRETKLEDQELQKLATDIISAQQKEIDFMKAKLDAMEGQ